MNKLISVLSFKQPICPTESWLLYSTCTARQVLNYICPKVVMMMMMMITIATDLSIEYIQAYNQY